MHRTVLISDRTCLLHNIYLLSLSFTTKLNKKLMNLLQIFRPLSIVRFQVMSMKHDSRQNSIFFSVGKFFVFLKSSLEWISCFIKEAQIKIQ